MPSETFNFTLPGLYTYNPALVTFLAGKVLLLDRRPANATFYAGFGTNKDANWGDGVLTGTLNGAAVVSGGVLDLPGVNDSAEWPGAQNVGADPKYICMRWRVKFDFTGAPGANTAILAVASSAASSNSQLGVYLHTAGNIYLTYKDFAGAGTNINMGAWTPTAGVWYEMEVNLDQDDGTGKVVTVLIDGNVFYQSGLVRTRGACNSILAGVNPGGFWDTGQMEFNDILIFDAFQHKAAYTPDWSGIYSTIYTLANPVVQTGQFLMGNLNSLTETAVKPGSDDVRYQFVFGGNTYWCNGVAWVPSDGTYTQANTAAQLVPACHCLCGQVGEGYYNLNVLLHSADGSTTPQLDRVVINYDLCPTPPEPEPPTPTPTLPDFLTQSSSARQRGPGGHRRGRPRHRYYPGPGGGYYPSGE